MNTGRDRELAVILGALLGRLFRQVPVSLKLNQRRFDLSNICSFDSLVCKHARLNDCYQQFESVYLPRADFLLIHLLEAINWSYPLRSKEPSTMQRLGKDQVKEPQRKSAKKKSQIQGKDKSCSSSSSKTMTSQWTLIQRLSFQKWDWYVIYFGGTNHLS